MAFEGLSDRLQATMQKCVVKESNKQILKR